MKRTFPELEKLARAIGQELRAAREDRGWTQEQLADAVQMGRATVSNLETGLINPSLMTFVHLTAALGVRPNQLLANALVVFEQRYETSLEKALKLPSEEPVSRPHRPRRVSASAKAAKATKKR